MSSHHRIEYFKVLTYSLFLRFPLVEGSAHEPSVMDLIPRFLHSTGPTVVSRGSADGWEIEKKGGEKGFVDKQSTVWIQVFFFGAPRKEGEPCMGYLDSGQSCREWKRGEYEVVGLSLVVWFLAPPRGFRNRSGNRITIRSGTCVGDLKNQVTIGLSNMDCIG